jgi:pimeloyl-ACP methyl ester carboxylesterase
MLARLQQLMTLGLLLWAAGWLWLFWPVDRLVALGGAVAILLSYTLILGAEFVLLARAHGADPAPRATRMALWRAWWCEVRVTPRVFFWRQPFRSSAEPDHLPANGPRTAQDCRPGLVLVHGLFCNRGFWNPWMRLLRTQGRAFIAVNLEPAWGDLDAHDATLANAVARLAEATGQAPLLVGHSMGGLVARRWVAERPAAQVAGVVTIGTPHGGTWMARLSRTVHGEQMGLRSAWLRRLEALEARGAHLADEGASGPPPFVCWYSNADNIVFPPSTACLHGADNRFVPVTAHVALAFHPRVMAETFALACP